MFNVDQKSQFIDFVLEKSTVKEIDTFRDSIINFFNRLEPIEQELGKDFAMCNYAEIELILSIFCRRSFKYQRANLSQLRKYLEWAIDSKYSLDTENRLIGLTPKDIDFSISYKMSMVKDEQMLSDYLDSVLKPMQDDSVDNMYRAMLHLIFNGISFKEVIDLKKDNVNLAGNKIKLEFKEISISSKCTELLKYLFEMTSFVSPMFHNGERLRSIIDTGHVLERSVENRENMLDSTSPIVSTIFSKIKEENNFYVSITANDLYTSGIFYRVYQAELETGEVLITEYLNKFKDHASSIENYDVIKSDGVEEYKAWKKAFNLA